MIQSDCNMSSTKVVSAVFKLESNATVQSPCEISVSKEFGGQTVSEHHFVVNIDKQNGDPTVQALKMDKGNAKQHLSSQTPMISHTSVVAQVAAPVKPIDEVMLWTICLLNCLGMYLHLMRRVLGQFIHQQLIVHQVHV